MIFSLFTSLRYKTSANLVRGFLLKTKKRPPENSRRPIFVNEKKNLKTN